MRGHLEYISLLQKYLVVTTLIISYYIVPVESYSNLDMLLQRSLMIFLLKSSQRQGFCCCFFQEGCWLRER